MEKLRRVPLLFGGWGRNGGVPGMPREDFITLNAPASWEQLKQELALLALIREALRLTGDEVGVIAPSELEHIFSSLREARNATLRRVAVLARAYLAELQEEVEMGAQHPMTLDQMHTH